MYRVTQLDNGLRVATAEMPHMLSTSVGLWVGVGSRYEPAPLNGVCHFIEHLLFKGTTRRSARDISQAIEGIGGYLNAFTSEEATCFHARASHERYDELLDVLLDMLLHSKFMPEDIDKEREVIKEEIAMYLDEPQHQVQELLNATLWPDQPLGRPITGTPKTLDGLARTQLLGYLVANYLSGNTLIVATGRVTHRQVLRAVRPYLSKLRKGPAAGLAPSRNDQPASQLRLLFKKTEQTQMALGIRTCSRHDERRYSLRLLNVILGENMSSRLFQTVREELGLAYSIYSTPSFFADTGDLVISAGLDVDKLEKTLKLILRELRRFTESAPSAADLRRARDYVAGQIDLGSESVDNQMNWLGEQVLGYGRVYRPEEIKQHLRRVSPAEVRATARDFFRRERLNLAIVSPLKNAARLAKLIQRF